MVDESELFQGDLGTTTTSTVPITTDSGEVFRAEVYTAVDVTEDPELREALLDGSLNRVEAPDEESDETYEPAVAVRYHDRDHRIFALVVPNELRHRALELRSELLEDLAETEAAIPDYVSGFATLFDPEKLEELEAAGTARSFAADTERELGDESSVPPPESIGDGAVDADELEEELAEIEREWEEIEQVREELEEREAQLEEVRERIDRERRQMDEVEQQLAAEREELEEMREELEAERQALEGERLQLEEQNRRAQQGLPDHSDEDTQVVTDDQFIEVTESGEMDAVDESAPADGSGPTGGSGSSSVGAESGPADASASGPAPADGSASEPAHADGGMGEPSAPAAGAHDPPARESTEIIQRPDDEWPEADDAFRVHVDPIEFDEVPETFDESRADDGGAFVDTVDGRILAACRLDDDRIEALTGGRPPRFYVQSRDVGGAPLAGLVLAALDDQAEVVASYGWPLDLSDDDDRDVLDELAEEMDLDVAIYDDDREVAEAYEVHGPLEENLQWIRLDVDERLEEADPSDDELATAAETYRSEDFERIGSMKHNFEREAFHALESPSQVKLAAGIVGYWSGDEQLRHLVANRSYPLLLFRALQEDVVEAAVDLGIHLEAPLREIAVDNDLVDDREELVELLLANFAEVSVQLRANDLDPVDEWENWDALISLAEDLDVEIDPDVVELAEASLKRARDYRETRQPADDEATRQEGGSAEQFIEDPGSVDVDDLVVGKRSEATGVTYYLPDEAVLDTFDDLADMPREDLEKLLQDPKGRLEAAQMLIERFDSDVVPTVMEAAERMAAPEVTALARFLETKADGLEPELVRGVESGGPSATFIATRALADIKSQSAIPTLVEAYRDSDRQLNRPAMARTLAGYGDKLVPAVTRSIREHGVDEHIVMLLQYLEDESSGLLDEIDDDRSDAVSDAVGRARNRSL